MSALLPLYRAATAIAAPLITHHLKGRLRRGKEDRERFAERQGQPSRPRPDGALVWVHAASVGESISMLPLVEALRGTYPELHILVTTGTVTSAALLAERLPEGAFHQYVPVDRTPYVTAFLDHWRPDLVLWAESEFWPNLTSLPAARGIPLVLINGRVSPESFAKWRRWPGFARTILNSFALCLAQAELDAERLQQLGAAPVKSVGNLKFAVPPLPADTAELTRLQQAFGNRPCWLAASTHAGEEDVIWRAHQEIAKAHPGLLTVIVPRHPDRGADIAAELQGLGARVRRRGISDLIDSATDVYIADTMGELGLFFRLCPISFMGKSLVNLGGQNPIEPARLEGAILFGPHMWNFPDVARHLVDAGGARQVTDSTTLAEAVTALLADKTKRQNMASAATAVATSETAVLDNVMAELAPYVEKIAGTESKT